MNLTRIRQHLLPEISFRTWLLVCILTTTIAASEALLSLGYRPYTIRAYTVLLVVLSLSHYFIQDSRLPILHAFAPIPVFRLVNLTMPVFVRPTLLWLPFIYAPFLLVVAYLGWHSSRTGRTVFRTDGSSNPQPVGIGRELPWWLGGVRGGRLRPLVRKFWQSLTPPEDASSKRVALYRIAAGLSVLLLPILVLAAIGSLTLVTVYLAEYRYVLTTPQPLISSLTPRSLALLTLVMVGFVGFVEELLFRGILQRVLERRLGLIAGLLIANGIFGLMTSSSVLPGDIAVAAGIGLFFGIVYDITDSLALVSVLHGGMNVFMFGIIPLSDGLPTETAWRSVVPAAKGALPEWFFELVTHIDIRILLGLL